MNVTDVRIEWTLPRTGRRRRRTRQACPRPDTATGRIPRISRLMALAIKLDGLIRDGAIRDYADIARLGFVTRARATQIMALLNLAPDLQERLLLLQPSAFGRDAITERHLRPSVAEAHWPQQRRLFSHLFPAPLAR
jgi:hypothetical protein